MSDRPPWDEEDSIAPWDEEPEPELTGVASAWKPSGSAKPKKRSPLSLKEQIGQQSTGFLSGLRQEAPNVLKRFGNLGSDIAQGWGDILSGRGSSDSRPAADIAKELRKREEEWKVRQQFEKESAPAPNENLGMSAGRLGAKAAPQIAAGIATGGASIPVQAGVGGGLELLQALSEGDTPGQAAFRGGLAGAAPGIGRGAKWAGGKLRSAAVDQFTKALHPTTRAAKVDAARIVPELLERRVSGNLDKLVARGTAESDKAGAGIAKQYALSKKTINAANLADELENLKDPFMGKSGFGGKSKARGAGFSMTRTNPPQTPVVIDEAAVKKINEIQDKLREFGDAVPPEELWKYRQKLDRIVRRSNGFTQELDADTAAEISKDARRVVQSELNKAEPDLVKLNAEYRLWESLQDVAGETAIRKTGQQGLPGMLARGAGGVVGTGVGWAAGGPFGAAAGAAIGNQATKKIADVMASPAWRTVSAVQKNEVAKLLERGEAEKALNLLSRVVLPTFVPPFGSPQGRR